jgi:hypothetical protein
MRGGKRKRRGKQTKINTKKNLLLSSLFFPFFLNILIFETPGVRKKNLFGNERFRDDIINERDGFRLKRFPF